MQTETRILRCLEERGQISSSSLAHELGLSRQIIHRTLNRLMKAGKVIKAGKSPKTFYQLTGAQTLLNSKPLNSVTTQLINENYLIITPAGEMLSGLAGFNYWCQKHQLPTEKTAEEYVATLTKYQSYRKQNLIDGKYKLQHTFDRVYLDEVFYLDFYSIERFGKTKLGQLLLYAKQSQDRKMIKALVEKIKTPIENLITLHQIGAVGFIPPTVKREVQFMKELEKNLNLSLPVIDLVKIKTPVVVPQKTLAKLEDRIENAQTTIVVTETRNFNQLLLIDDALGSGATLNETAKKLKERGVAKKIIGLAITGSFSGFEVISEV